MTTTLGNKKNRRTQPAALGVFLALLLFTAPAAASAPGMPAMKNPAPAQLTAASGDIIHTVRKNESLWQIALYFGADYNELIRLNRIKNPDLIFPGEKLLIQIQADYSIRVLADEPVNEDGPPALAQAVAHITYPDKNEVFSPENPIAEYKIEETLAPLRRQAPASQTIGVFHTFLEFVEWLSAEFGFPRQTEASRTVSPDSGFTLSFEVSRAPDTQARFGKGLSLLESEDFYQAPPADKALPPPKSW